jgi:hypothetical protein
MAPYQKMKERPMTSDFMAGITVNTHCKLLVCNFVKFIGTLVEKMWFLGMVRFLSHGRSEG